MSDMASPYKELLQRATTTADRWIILLSALLIGGFGWQISSRPPGQQAIIERDNQIILTLPLSHNQRQEVQGRLGSVAIEVEDGRVRLLEYASPRMIGTRSGWISRSGAMLACIPCGILIRVEGGSTAPADNQPYDSIAR
ncbi:MAG: NusG domain II-containing protein [Magnetococcales bacterium]|nr:NusG domain II-containing protein [Magnetococcales bacterium]